MGCVSCSGYSAPVAMLRNTLRRPDQYMYSTGSIGRSTRDRLSDGQLKEIIHINGLKLTMGVDVVRSRLVYVTKQHGYGHAVCTGCGCGRLRLRTTPEHRQVSDITGAAAAAALRVHRATVRSRVKRGSAITCMYLAVLPT